MVYNDTMLVRRPDVCQKIEDSFSIHRACALLGPRQCGKTTLARMIAEGEPGATFFDLERAPDRRRLETPELTLSSLEGLVVIDEIQREPRLFEVLRVLLDRPEAKTRFLLLGSASPSLIKQASETMAGRVGLVDLSGFNLTETPLPQWKKLWYRGGFPRSFLAPDDSASVLWRESFLRTFLERDIPLLGISVRPESLRRFWSMVAHYHGQIWNASEFARAMGTGEGTARNYLNILQGAYVLRVLSPWHENLKKRQVKSPKIYIRDSGLLHALLEIESPGILSGHPKIGASFEGFVIEQLISCLHPKSAYFWATHGGAELDILINMDGKRHGFECKYSDAPRFTRSMGIAIKNLGLERLWVIYPGREYYQLNESAWAVPLEQMDRITGRRRKNGL